MAIMKELETIPERELAQQLPFSSCQSHQKCSWSPVAALFPERSTPGLLNQLVKGVSVQHIRECAANEVVSRNCSNARARVKDGDMCVFISYCT
jgi:hypothetical protein